MPDQFPTKPLKFQVLPVSKDGDRSFLSFSWSQNPRLERLSRILAVFRYLHSPVAHHHPWQPGYPVPVSSGASTHANPFRELSRSLLCPHVAPSRLRFPSNPSVFRGSARSTLLSLRSQSPGLRPVKHYPPTLRLLVSGVLGLAGNASGQLSIILCKVRHFESSAKTAPRPFPSPPPLENPPRLPHPDASLWGKPLAHSSLPGLTP